MRCPKCSLLLSCCLMTLTSLHHASASDMCAFPDYNQTVTFGGVEAEEVRGMAVSPNGSVVVTGFFCGAVDFDPGPGEDIHVSNGNDDAFINALDSNGLHMWTHTFGAAGFDTVDGVAIAADGSIFVAGTYWNTVDFDPTEGVDEQTSNGFSDVFVSKYLSDGSYVWTRTVGGPEFDDMQAIAWSNDGGILSTGSFRGEVDFDPGEGVDERDAHGGGDAFLMKLSSGGDYEWTLTFGDDGSESSQDIAIAPDESILLLGFFTSDEVDFDPSDGEDVHFSNGLFDIFLSKFTSAGEHQWTRTIGGPDVDDARGMAIDNSGAIVVSGFFLGSAPVDFDPSEGVDERISNGGGDAYVWKLKSDGSYAWTWTAGAEEGDVAYDVAIDSAANIFVTGEFGDNIVDYAVDFDQSGSGAEMFMSPTAKTTCL